MQISQLVWIVIIISILILSVIVTIVVLSELVIIDVFVLVKVCGVFGSQLCDDRFCWKMYKFDNLFFLLMSEIHKSVSQVEHFIATAPTQNVSLHPMVLSKISQSRSQSILFINLLK